MSDLHFAPKGGRPLNGALTEAEGAARGRIGRIAVPERTIRRLDGPAQSLTVLERVGFERFAHLAMTCFAMTCSILPN